MAKTQFPGWPSRDLVNPLPDGLEPIQYVPEVEEAPEAPVSEETPEAPVTPPSEEDNG